jgi:hypothetical protein
VTYQRHCIPAVVISCKSWKEKIELTFEVFKIQKNSKWKWFISNISSAFKELSDDKYLFDVTLACDDEQIQAHNVILSACSPYFRNILRWNHHQHPLLYLKGVKYTDLQSVLNFMYHREINLAQEELNSFLVVAEDRPADRLPAALPHPHNREVIFQNL